MKKIIFVTVACLILVNVSHAQKLDKQSHRGGRGLMPENTIAAMKNAMDWGTNLEMDLYITKDKQVIVDHDGCISSVYALNPDGSPVTKEQAKGYRLVDMPYQHIEKFDVGSRGNPEFPHQKKMVAHIPLFATLIDSIEAYAKAKHMTAPRYNPEAKVPGGKLEPNYRENLTKAIMEIVKKKKIQKRVIIQSFDIDVLEMLHRNYPKIKTSYLVYVGRDDWQGNLKKLSFKPYAYSPYYKQVNKEMVDQCHRDKIKVVTWTVNTKEEIEELKALGVDGIITDYPNLFQ